MGRCWPWPGRPHFYRQGPAPNRSLLFANPSLLMARPHTSIRPRSIQGRPNSSPAHPNNFEPRGPPGLLRCCEEQTLITHCHISITSQSRTFGIEYFLRCPCSKPRCCDSNGSSSATPYPPRLGIAVEAKVSSRNLWWKDCCTWQCAIKDVRATGEAHNVFGLGRPGLPIPHFNQ